MFDPDPDEAIANDRQAEPRTAVGRVFRVLRVVLVLAVAAAIVYAVVRDWAAVQATFRTLSWGAIVLSTVAATAGLLATAKVWQALLKGLGNPLRGAHATQVYLTGQLARYLPGSVWAFFLQAHLGKRHEIPRTRSFLTVLISVGVNSATGLTLAVLAIPALREHWGGVAWLLALGPLSLLALIPRVLTWLADRFLKVLRRPPLEAPILGRSIAIATAWSVVVWLLFGLHLYVLLRAIQPSVAGGFVLSIATFALAVAAGFLAFVLPSGIGVREAVIVAALTTVLSAGSALAVALISRLLCTLSDVIGAAVGEVSSALTDRRDRRATMQSD